MTLSKREIARRFFVHNPADLAQSYVHWAERLKAEPGITYGCVMDKHVIPLHPGDLMAVLARPGHGKSSWMAYMAKHAAQDIVKRGAKDEVVVYVTWEQTVEEIEAFFQSGDDYTSTDMAWGRASMDAIKSKSVKRVNLPIWTFGESKRHEGIDRPKMTVDYVYEAVESMWDDYKVKPVLMCLDYVQIMPTASSGKADRIFQVHEAVNNAKQLAIRMGLPIVIGVQAGRTVDTYKNPIPTMSDAQWSSSIEQVVDKLIAVWRPAKTHDPDKEPYITIAGTEYKNDDELFVVKLLKQRFDAGFGTWAVKFKPQTLQLWDYETYNLNGRGEAGNRDNEDYAPLRF